MPKTLGEASESSASSSSDENPPQTIYVEGVAIATTATKGKRVSKKKMQERKDATRQEQVERIKQAIKQSQRGTKRKEREEGERRGHVGRQMRYSYLLAITAFPALS